MAFKRRSLTAAMVQVRFTQLPAGIIGKINESSGLVGSEDLTRATIARAQSISTNDAMPYARVKQIGYGTVVEDVPLFMEGTGNLSVIETVDGASLYKLGIYDFVNYLLSCERDPLEIGIFAACVDGQVGTEQLNGAIDRLTNVKFTAVARAIDVGGQLVSNSASFYYIRSLNPDTYLP